MTVNCFVSKHCLKHGPCFKGVQSFVRKEKFISIKG